MCVCVVKASRVVTSVSSLRSSPVDVCELHTPLSLTASSPALVWLMLLLSILVEEGSACCAGVRRTILGADVLAIVTDEERGKDCGSRDEEELKEAQGRCADDRRQARSAGRRLRKLFKRRYG